MLQSSPGAVPGEHKRVNILRRVMGPCGSPGARSAVQQKLLCFVAFAQTTEWSLNVAGADYKISLLLSRLTPSLLKCF